MALAAKCYGCGDVGSAGTHTGNPIAPVSSYSTPVNYSNDFRTVSTYRESKPHIKNDYVVSRLPGIDVEIVPTYKLENDKNILGMAFPPANLVQISENLNEKQKLEVLVHEINHIRMPNKGESQIRKETADMLKNLDITPDFHNDDYLGVV